MRKPKKKTVVIVIAIVLIVAILRALSFPLIHDYTLKGTWLMDKKYVQQVDLKELGKYEKLKYQYHSEVAIVFGSEASATTAFYTEENFKNQLDYIKNNYQFMDDYIVNYWGEREQIPSVSRVNGWNIKLVDIYGESDEEVYNDYPKEVKIIAYNPSENKIAYIDFFDSDLDYISSLEAFVEGYCDYKL